MPEDWLTVGMREMLARLPRPQFAPSLIFDFDHVQRSISIVESAITDEQARTQTEHLKTAARAAQNPFHSYIENPVFAPMAASLWNAEMTLPMILRRSLLIAVSSHVEHVLRRWSTLLHDEWHLAKIEKKPQGRPDLEHFMIYLRDVASLSLGGFENWAEWPRIDAYRIARNCLTHDGGIIDTLAKRAAIETLPHVEIDTMLMGEPMVHLLPGACEDAAEKAQAFF
jgi:hypothetical protein